VTAQARISQADMERARWPRLMKLASASAYCDLTPAAFEREIGAGRLPSGREIGGKEHWDRVALDKAIDALMGSSEPDWRQDLRKRYGKAP
jgi:hypothetical protein